MYFSNYLCFFLSLSAVHAVDPLVDLGYAKYQGHTLDNGVNEWLSLRFAAPPTGKLRFSAPQPPLKETSTQDAVTEGALCVAANKPEGLQNGSPRQRMAEDCLFLGLYAPLNATANSKLPIMFFIQGGGFSSNSNGNFNGTGLVERSGMNMIVVRINYRVGILGFIGGTAVNADQNGAIDNNGLNDMIAAARWVKQHATKFGGNPDQIVLSADSSGANAADIILTANNGTGFPDLFAGAMLESTGWGSEGFPVDRDNAFNNNVNSTGCLDATDPIECMRQIPIEVFQNTTAKDGWGPTIDGGKWLVAPHYQMMEQGRFQKIPIIYGSASNEGTPSFISNQSVSTDADIEAHIKGSVGASITDAEVSAMMKAYPASLNEFSFFGRNMTARNATLREGSGRQWQRDAAIFTELKLQCVSQFFCDMNSMEGSTSIWHYRHNVLDTTPGGLADTGIFTPHTSELYAIWGTNNTDGNDPDCYKIAAKDGGCAEAIDIVSSYWMSFVRSLDPNSFRLPGTPAWDTWSIEAPKRIVFENAEASMETVGSEPAVAGMNQRQRCVKLALPLSKRIIAGLGANETLPPFANGTRPDPTASVVKGSGSRTNFTGMPKHMANTSTLPGSGENSSTDAGGSNNAAGDSASSAAGSDAQTSATAAAIGNSGSMTAVSSAVALLAGFIALLAAAGMM